VAYVLDDPDLEHRSAGEEFVRVAGASRGDVDVSLNVVLTTVFPLAATRPRYTVRHLLRSVVSRHEPVATVTELRTEAGPDVSSTTYGATPEATFRPRLSHTGMTDVSVELEVPEGLADDPALFAAYVDHRVIVRLCTVENEALLHGSADAVIPGLLGLDGLRRRPAPRDLDDEIAAAAAEVEEMGGSCDGIVAHPDVYWRLLRTGMLSRLGDAGLRVSRTRMIATDQILLGDMRAAVTLIDRGTSTLSLRRGAGPDGHDVVRATQRVGLAINLPQHFLLLDLPGAGT
jgi:hypothetical protein